MADGFGYFLKAAESGVRSFQRNRASQIQNLVRQQEMERKKSEADAKAGAEIEKKAAKQRIQAVADQVGGILSNPLNFEKGSLIPERELEAAAMIAQIADDDASVANSLASLVKSYVWKPKVKPAEELAAEELNKFNAHKLAYEQASGRKLTPAQIDDYFKVSQPKPEKSAGQLFDEMEAERKAFGSSYLAANPTASEEEVRQAVNAKFYGVREGQGGITSKDQAKLLKALRGESITSAAPPPEESQKATPSLFTPQNQEPELPVLPQEEAMPPALMPQEPETEDDVRQALGDVARFKTYKPARTYFQAAVRKNLLTQPAYDSLHARVLSKLPGK